MQTNQTFVTTTSMLPPALDPVMIEMLRGLRMEGEPDPIADLTASFVEDGLRRLAAIQAATAASDVTAFRRAAHSLKGMSATIGATHLSELTAEIERAEPGTIDQLKIQQLEQEFGRVAVALRNAA